MNKNYGLTASFIICAFVYLIAITIAGAFLFFYEGDLNPLWRGLIADVIATVVVFIFSYLFKNSSLYDPYWSVAPPLLAIYWYTTANYLPIVKNAISISICIWAIRLTLNWARGWHGLKHEDWRYVMLHDKNPKFYWFTSFAGIHMFPTIMVFLGMLPVFFAGNANTIPQCDAQYFSKYILLTGFVICVAATIIELLADEQMRSFKKRANPDEFINEGLWKYSRHPNYFGEIAFWFGLWVLMMSIEPSYWWSSIGFIAMLIMFRFASIPMMEEKNLKSKPGYKNYMSEVSMIIPWFIKGK
jgi:steroid 5-alpha reductase family enzyme